MNLMKLCKFSDVEFTERVYLWPSEILDMLIGKTRGSIFVGGSKGQSFVIETFWTRERIAVVCETLDLGLLNVRLLSGHSFYLSLLLAYDNIWLDFRHSLFSHPIDASAHHF